jgi:group I intron endonuclease
MIIYKTTNLVNGKFYIGQDLNNNPNYLGSGLMLNNAIKKYGIENFKKEIIEVCNSKEELNEREKFWIKELNSQNREKGYNISDGGSGGKTWQNYTDLEMIKHTREKRSRSTSERNRRIGGFLKDKNKQRESCIKGNLSRQMKGYKHSEETKMKIGNAHRGKEISEESRKNISNATKEAMENVDMKTLYQQKVKAKLEAAWAARDKNALEQLRELDMTDMNNQQKCKALGVSYPTYQKYRKMIDTLK